MVEEDTGPARETMEYPALSSASPKSGTRTEAFSPRIVSASVRPEVEVPVLTLTDGVTVRGDDDTVHGLLAEHLARPSVTLAKEASIPHHDEAAVHLVTTSTLAWLRDRAPGVTVDERRLRPNLLVDTGSAPGLAEETWIGQVIRVGDVELEILRRAVRCVMVDLPYADLAAAPGLFKTIATHNDQLLGVHARVVRGGTVRVGDRVGR